MDDPLTLLLMCAVIAAASVFRGFTGFGFAITAVPLLSLVMPPQGAVAVSAVMQALGGLIDFPTARRGCHWPSVRSLAIGAVLTSVPGALLLTLMSADVARLLVASVCALAVASLAAGLAFRRVPDLGGTILTGAAAGLFSGMAAMPGPPVITFYLASPLPTAQVRASMSVFFMFAAAVSCLGLGTAGALGWGEMRLALLGTPIMLAGTLLGAWLFRHLGGAHRRVSLAALALVAVTTAAKGLTGLFGG